jgi:hypothetical protein
MRVAVALANVIDPKLDSAQRGALRRIANTKTIAITR